MKASLLIAIWRSLSTIPFLVAVFWERVRQEQKWGPQRHPSFRRNAFMSRRMVDDAKRLCDLSFKIGNGSWAVIFNEEAVEALGAETPEELRLEQIQTAAVLGAWWCSTKNRDHRFML